MLEAFPKFSCREMGYISFRNTIYTNYLKIAPLADTPKKVNYLEISSDWKIYPAFRKYICDEVLVTSVAQRQVDETTLNVTYLTL